LVFLVVFDLKRKGEPLSAFGVVAAASIVGGIVATVTIVGLVSSSVDSSSDNPANVNAPSIDYGSSNN
jgi:TctA family transporter